MDQTYDFAIDLDQIDAHLAACTEETVVMKTALVRGLAFELRRAWLANQLLIVAHQEELRVWRSSGADLTGTDKWLREVFEDA